MNARAQHVPLYQENPYWELWRESEALSRRGGRWSVETYVELEKLGLSRDALRRRFAYAIPDQRAIDICAALGPIVELGAGTGYWASLIAAAGGDVIAYDDGSWKLAEGASYFPIQQGTPESLAEHTDRALFLCWPPYSHVMCEHALDHYTGSTLIYIGEGHGGCTGTDAFHERLEADFECIDGCSLPQWDGIHDHLSVYRRRS